MQLGLPPRVFNAARKFYRQHSRCFRVGGHFGRFWHPTNGWIQGCALTIIFCNLLFAVLAHTTTREIPAVTVKFFIDDEVLRTVVQQPDQALEDLKNAILLNLQFDSLTGQLTNLEKSHGCGTTSSLRKLVASIVPTAKVPKLFLSLGYVVNTTKGPLRALQNERLEKADKTLDAICVVRRSKDDKAYYIEVCPMAQLEYGTATGWPSADRLDTMATKVIRVAFSATRKLASPWLVFALCLKIHRIDPRGRLIWHTLTTARKMLSGNEEATQHVIEILAEPKSNIPGVAATIRSAVQPLEWKHARELTFDRPHDTPLSLTEGSNTWWHHELRRSMKFAWTQRVSDRRESPGLRDHHVAWLATTAMMRDSLSRNLRKLIAPLLDQLGGMPSKRIQKTVGSIVSGSIRDGIVLQRSAARGTPICPFCNFAVNEDRKHMWQGCPTWDRTRNRFGQWRPLVGGFSDRDSTPCRCA